MSYNKEIKTSNLERDANSFVTVLSFINSTHGKLFSFRSQEEEYSVPCLVSQPANAEVIPAVIWFRRNELILTGFCKIDLQTSIPQKIHRQIMLTMNLWPKVLSMQLFLTTKYVLRFEQPSHLHSFRSHESRGYQRVLKI